MRAAPEDQLVWGIFVRAVAGCYAVTFLSEAHQILGLLGSRGILSIAEFIDVATRELSAPYRYLRLPTLFWLNASDGFIAALPWLGLAAAILVVAGIASRVCLLLCYCLHQSTVVAGGDFYFYPWDFLLLETTILTLFVPRLERLPSLRAAGPPPPLVAFAILSLLFRLQFGMGIHKFYDASDEGWRTLSYVYHWHPAQPMPTAAAWYAYHYLPTWLHAGMDVLTFLAEVPLPFLLFIPGKPRLFAVVIIALLHAGIALLGNFGTFQLISLALCVACFRPRPLPRLARGRSFDVLAGSAVAIVAMACGVLFTLRMLQPNGLTVLSNTRWLFTPEAEHSMTYPGSRLLRIVSPFFLSYPYGIFRESALGAGPRRGFVFQGSHDGVVWKTYENEFNPVEPIERRPQFFAPYQPRLDHLFIYEAGQFHFAYLNGINPYYGARRPLPFIAAGLFARSPDVLSLFATNPFPDRPPVAIRLRVASYRFTSPEERAATGAWWNRSDETIVGPFDAALTAALVAEERAAARAGLARAIEVDERTRAGAAIAPPESRREAWMPPWLFWLATAAGWLPLVWFGARNLKPRRN